eukprot:COSAG01_NODE_315_length_19007_cov_18.180135_13_plen_90_part_00
MIPPWLVLAIHWCTVVQWGHSSLLRKQCRRWWPEDLAQVWSLQQACGISAADAPAALAVVPAAPMYPCAYQDLRKGQRFAGRVTLCQRL